MLRHDRRCGPAGHRPTERHRPSTTTVAPTSTTPDGDGSTGEDAPERAGISSERRTALGLPSEGQAPQGLAPLSKEQWVEPEAVAARFVLVETNYAASEDPRAVGARSAVYVSERLRHELAASSSGTAALEELRRAGAVFHGEVLAVAKEASSADLAVVSLTVRTTTSLAAQPSPPPRVAFYRLTLSPERGGGRWLVVGVERS